MCKIIVNNFKKSIKIHVVCSRLNSFMKLAEDHCSKFVFHGWKLKITVVENVQRLLRMSHSLDLIFFDRCRRDTWKSKVHKLYYAISSGGSSVFLLLLIFCVVDFELFGVRWLVFCVSVGFKHIKLFLFLVFSRCHGRTFSHFNLDKGRK